MPNSQISNESNQQITNSIELRSEEVQDILAQVPHWILRWGNIIIFILLLLLILFSYIIKYPQIITTTVVITTQNPPEKLVARTSGKISKILVKDRSELAPKTPLAIIENTANYSDVFKLKECIDTLQIINSQFVFPIESFSNSQLGDVQNSFSQFQRDYLAFNLNRNFRPHYVEKKAQILEKNELRVRLQLQSQQFKIGLNEYRLKKQELERFKKLYDKGIISSQEWEVKNLEYLQIEKNVRINLSQLSQMQSSINEIDKNLTNANINETKDTINLFKNTIQSYNLLKKSINDWEMTYVFRSSIQGKISFMQIWTENQTINSGDQVFTIVPSNNENYIGKLKAEIQNSGKIKINQEVNIRLANYPDKEFGIIKGRVKSISLTPDKDGYLLIDISLPRGIKTSYKKEIIFQQEMNGTADIITEDLRLIERFFYQFRVFFNR